MPLGSVFSSCFGSPGSGLPLGRGDGPAATSASGTHSLSPAAGFLSRATGDLRHPAQQQQAKQTSARRSEDASDARDSGSSNGPPPQAQIQRILAACSMSPAGPGPLSTLSRMGLNTLCMGMEVPLALVVFEDAENELVQPMDDAASSFTSFQMQPHPWQFMFKVRCVWVNGATQHALGVRSADEAVQHISTNSNKNTAMRCDLMGLLKGIEHGQGQAIKTWNTYYQNKDMDLAALWLQPCLWSTADGSRFIACLIYTEPQPSHAALLKAMAQDHMCLESIPYSVTTVNEQGMICSQNAAARASFGAFLSVLNGGHGINFLKELFYGHADLRAKMHRQLQVASSFQVCIQLLSPLLREWLNLEDGDEVWHQLYITRVAGAGPSDPAYVIVQPDITDMVVTERKVAQLQQQHQGLLKEILPPEVMEAILHSKMMQDAAPAGAGARGLRDAQDIGVFLEDEREGEDNDSTTMPTSRSSHQLAQLASNASQPANMLRTMPRCRRPSHMVVHETHSTLNNMHLASQEGMANAHVGTSTTLPQLQDKKGIWLTQQDVQNLATNHESVTILFADIKGFTALSQTLHPAEVMLFLNQLYSIWDAMLDSYGVYKVETIGDSYMVAGGLFSIDPVTRTPKLGGYDPRHAQKVLDFGRAMLESASLVLDPRGDPVQIRIGIHSGACVSGVVGQRMPRFCLFGDTINTASRMESTCPRPGCIHASSASQALLPHEPWVPTGGVFCKGKGVMQTYYVHIAADMMTPEELAEEQKLLLPASLLVAGASEAPSDAQQGDGLSRAQSSTLPHNAAGPGSSDTADGLELAAPSAAMPPPSHLPFDAARLSTVLSAANEPSDDDMLWDARSHFGDTPSNGSAASNSHDTAAGSRGLFKIHGGAMTTPLPSPSHPETAAAGCAPCAADPVTQSGGMCLDDGPESVLYQGVRVRAHIKATPDMVGGTTMSEGQAMHGELMSQGLMGLTGIGSSPGPSGMLAGFNTTSGGQHTLSKSVGATPRGPDAWPVVLQQQDVQSAAHCDVSRDLLTGPCSVTAAATLVNQSEGMAYSMSGSLVRRPSPDSPQACMPGFGQETPPPPITPAATPPLGRRTETWKAMSNDGHARSYAATSRPPTLGRLSTVAEQAQRVLQELHQSRPRPRDFGAKPPSISGLDRRMSMDVWRRGSMDVHRAGIDAPHRGSLDLAWATVGKFQRSESPRPEALTEYPDQAGDAGYAGN